MCQFTNVMMLLLFCGRQSDSAETIDCIRNKTVSELLSVNTQGSSLIDRLNTNYQFLPTIDGDLLPGVRLVCCSRETNTQLLMCIHILISKELS